MDKFTKQYEFLLKRGITNQGVYIPKDKTVTDIGAVSLYYMVDKSSWQIKLWFLPMNDRTTYNIDIKSENVGYWIEAIEALSPSNDDPFNDEKYIEENYHE